jgi:hypothetical protein
LVIQNLNPIACVPSLPACSRPCTIYCHHLLLPPPLCDVCHPPLDRDSVVSLAPTALHRSRGCRAWKDCSAAEWGRTQTTQAERRGLCSVTTVAQCRIQHTSWLFVVGRCPAIPPTPSTSEKRTRKSRTHPWRQVRLASKTMRLPISSMPYHDHSSSGRTPPDPQLSRSRSTPSQRSILAGRTLRNRTLNRPNRCATDPPTTVPICVHEATAAQPS